MCPGGTGYGGRFGATRARSNAHSSPSAAAVATACGWRACRTSISVADRRWAPAVAGSQPSRSSRDERARTAASAPARSASRGVGVVHTAGRDERQPGRRRQRGQGVDALGVPRVADVGHLDRDVVPAEQRHQPVQLPPRRGGADGPCARTTRGLAIPGRATPDRAAPAATLERAADGALAAPGEHEPLAVGLLARGPRACTPRHPCGPCRGGRSRSPGRGCGSPGRRGPGRAGGWTAGPGRRWAGRGRHRSGWGPAGGARRRRPWAARRPSPPGRTAPRRTGRRGR